MIDIQLDTTYEQGTPHAIKMYDIKIQMTMFKHVYHLKMTQTWG
jgi:hypothetical protein